MSVIQKIFNFIKFIFTKIWYMVDFALKLAWRFIVPIALVGLLIVPIALTYFPAAKKPEPIIVKAAEKGNITKKITVQGTTEYAYSYDLPVYNDATLTEVLVKAGDKVTAGQVLAKLDFVTETKVRVTSVENQIRGFQQEITNNNRALADASNVNAANSNQMKVTRADKFLEINELYQKKADKINELAQKKVNYQKEKDDFDKQIRELENFKDGTDAVKQYQDKIDADRLQLATFDNSNLNAQLQNQQNTANTQISSAQTTLTNAQNARNAACSALLLVQSVCDTATTQLNTAQDAYNTINNSNSNINTQINNNNNINSINRNFLINRINDNQNRINTLGNARLYEPNKTTDLPITETAKTGRLQILITELRADSSLRKTKIQAIEDNVELTPINDQILAKQKVIDELKATQVVNNETMNQTVSGIQQRTDTAANSLNNANLTLSDTIEDIQKQEKNKTITAKKDGTIGKVFTEQGLVVKSRDNQFTVVSDKYRLKFTVSADSRSQLKNGLKVIADKYPKLENIAITEANLVPDVAPVTATTASATVNYTIYAELPLTTDYNYTQGETVNVDVIINESKDVLYVPSTSTDKGYVYVGVDPTFPDVTKKPTFPATSTTSSTTIVDPATLPTFKSAKKVKIKTGLDDNKNIQILEGLKEGEWVFTIFPRTDKDRLAIKAPEEGETNDKPEEVNDGTSGIE